MTLPRPVATATIHPPAWPLRPQTRAALALTLAALLWSGNFVVAREMRHDIDAVTLNLLRWSLCLGVFVPFVGARAWRCRHVVRREWRLLLALGASGMAGFHTLVYVAVTRAPAVNAVLMLTLVPTAILIGAVLTKAAAPSRRVWAGSAVSLLGAWLLVGPVGPGGPPALDNGGGALLMAMAVVLWAVYSLLLQRRPPDLPADVALAGTMVAALALLVPAAVLVAPSAPLVWTPRLVGSLFYIVVFASLGGFLLWSYGVARIGPEKAGQFVHLMPLFGTALATVLLGERVLPAQLAGATCVLAGLALAQRRARQPSPR